MPRLRYNGLATGSAGSLVGLSLGASLTNSATSVTFNAALTYQNGTAVPTISGSDYIPLEILDANGRLTEIVWLTAYTTAGTTGTIARGKEGTTGVAHSSGDKVIHGPTVGDLTTPYSNWDAAVSAEIGSALVHRWKFDETSGTSVADSIGSLTLTLSGTVTRNVASKTGVATTFGASAYAVSSGLGSLPTGNASRCFIVIYRTSADTTQQTLVSYGAQSTRQWWDAEHQTADCPALATWGDDLNPAVKTPVIGPEIAGPSGRAWRFGAYGYNATTQETYAYRDGVMFSRATGVQATATSGNFQVGMPVVSGTSRFAGDIDDILVLNTWPGKTLLDRLLGEIAA